MAVKEISTIPPVSGPLQLLDDSGPGETFPTLEQINEAEPEFWRRIEAHGVAESRGGRPPPACIAEDNFRLLLRYRDFRAAAEYVARELEKFPFVLRAILFGSLTKPLYKEVPRFYDYRRYNVALWHEVKDIDIALWVANLDELTALKRARNQGVTRLQKERNINVAPHECDLFLFDPDDNRYLGRVCHYRECPKMNAVCQVPGCGDIKFVRQHEDFEFNPAALAESTVVVFFDRRH